VLALVLSVAAYFLKTQIQIFVQLGVCLVSLAACFFAYRTGESGGELVYEHGAASAYATPSHPNVNGLLPTPGLNTSESDENESLKSDDNDYGNSDETEDVEDDESKQED
jgi:hypothetical protein